MSIKLPIKAVQYLTFHFLYRWEKRPSRAPPIFTSHSRQSRGKNQNPTLRSSHANRHSLKFPASTAAARRKEIALCMCIYVTKFNGLTNSAFIYYQRTNTHTHTAWACNRILDSKARGYIQGTIQGRAHAIEITRRGGGRRINYKIIKAARKWRRARARFGTREFLFLRFEWGGSGRNDCV